MRKSEIEAIKIEDVLELLLTRIPEQLDEEGNIIEPTQEQIESEFQTYKNELDKQRRDELHLQFDKRQFAQGLYNLGHRVKNLKTFIGSLIVNDNIDILNQLEVELSNMEAEIASNKWLEERKVEYAKIDIMLMEAIAEKEAGDPTKMEAYLAIRADIKARIPKP